MIDFKQILENGCTISSSGTTGIPKTIFRTPDNLTACIKVAIEGQDISSKSSIFVLLFKQLINENNYCWCW